VKVDESQPNASKAIRARQEIKPNAANTPEAPALGTPLLFDITANTTSPAHSEDLPPPQPDFWYYQLDLMEFWSGDMLKATGDFRGVGVDARFHFEGTEHFMWAKINDKYLHIDYDFHHHCKPCQSILEHPLVLTC
jgi:hypothetical protein